MTVQIQTFETKRSADKLFRGFDLTDFCSLFWTARSIVEVDACMRPTQTKTTGYQYRVTAGGQLGTKEPSWPTTIGVTVKSGSVTLVCEAISNASLQRNILDDSKVIWTTASGMTVTDTVLINTDGRVQIAALHGGGVDGDEDLPTVAKVTFTDGQVKEFARLFSVDDSLEPDEEST